MGGKVSFPRILIPAERTYVVTGANRGIGYEVTKWLAMMGATVVMACRSEDSAIKAIQKMNREYKEARQNNVEGLADKEELSLHFMPLDLASFDSTKNFVKAYRESGRPLHVLVCNAGISKSKPVKTEDGFEAMLQVNYLSQFLMIGQLLPLMKNSGNDVRIVLVSADAHKICRFSLDGMNYSGDPEKFWYLDYYGRTKLYQVMLMYSLSRRLRHSNIAVTSVHPGTVETDIGQEFFDMKAYQAFLTIHRLLGIMKTPFEGASSVINCASNPELSGVSGKYYKDCVEAGTNALSRDETTQEQVWTKTLDFLKGHLTDDEVFCLEGADPE